MTTIPGWDVTEDDGLLTAVRRRDEPITDYQAEHGVLDELTARDGRELFALAVGQSTLLNLVQQAEEIHDGRRAEIRALAG